ncbi:hypothetical protein ABIB25_003554 [Nakamurella sp. UYEF19]|uniref:glycosyltransferase n=1 Tax=Nakamurella sp. UYEF19 TaxID=1756392 RepID=UPI0033910EFD
MIGYYVHHQGQGHLQRMTAIVAHLAEPVTVMSSLPRPSAGPEWVPLPPDDTGVTFLEPTANGTLHWAPRHHPGLQARMAMISSWIARTAPTLVVVDVSVEVATLCSLFGVPTVVMAMRGDRSDRPHRTAYDGAHALIAPWLAEFHHTGWPKAWSDKTFHAGPITHPAERPAPVKVAHDGSPKVLVLWGSGGTNAVDAGFTTDQLVAARASAPSWHWRFAGGRAEHRVERQEVRALLHWADVVITHAGQNAVAEVAASGTPAVVIADIRPHGEQLDTAMSLDTAGVAIGLARWPEPDEWPALLDAALARGGEGWRRWICPGGAERAARFLDETAAGLRRTARTATARSAPHASTVPTA